MIVREMRESDIPILQQIHKRDYDAEFPFPILNGFTDYFVVTNDDGDIITSGGLKPILEIIGITDKTQSPRNRRAALLILFQALAFAAGKLGHDQIHAFIQDENWSNQLKTAGFKDTKGKALVMSF